MESLLVKYLRFGREMEGHCKKTEMKRVGLRKEKGWSFVDVGGVEGFKFVSVGSRHCDAEQIYAVCHSMNKHMADVVADAHQLSPAVVV
jgi:hypothetical protein